jgi:Cys-tRNA(Pro)/Cys-tRNA(Cys) deacylase
MNKTRAIELLETAKVSFEVQDFAAVEFTAEEAADKLGFPISSVYKTLVAKGERSGVVVAIIPGDRELSLKKLAAALGDKRVEMVKPADLQRLTGYLKGGCSPLAQKKQYPTFLADTALNLPQISISAGLRGLQIIIAPADLIRLSGAKVADLTE